MVIPPHSPAVGCVAFFTEYQIKQSPALKVSHFMCIKTKTVIDNCNEKLMVGIMKENDFCLLLQIKMKKLWIDLVGGRFWFRCL